MTNKDFFKNHGKKLQYFTVIIIIAITVAYSLQYIEKSIKEDIQSSEFFIGFANIWLLSSLFVSLFITGGCFVMIFYNFLKFPVASDYSDDFKNLYKHGAVFTFILFLFLLLGFAIYISKFSTFFESKTCFTVTTICSVAIAGLICLIDFLLPGLKSLAKNYDLPIFFSILGISLISCVLSLSIDTSFVAIFSAGAIAFQIIYANLNFAFDVYLMETMYDKYKKEKQNEQTMSL